MTFRPSRRRLLRSGAASLLALPAAAPAGDAEPGSGIVDAARSLSPGERRTLAGDGGAVDLSPAIQRMVDGLAAAGGGTVFLPPGRYALYRPLRLPPGVDLVGAGWATILRPRGCSAVELAGQSGFGRTLLGDFRIQGSSTTDRAAIAQRPGADPDDEFAGLTIEGVLVDHFAAAVRLSTVRHAAVRDCWFRDVRSGIALEGKCLVVDVDRVAMEAVADGTAADGIVTDWRTYAGGRLLRPETVRIRSLYAFGFRTGVRFEAVVHGVVEDCDLSATRDGISWSSASGVVNVRGGYIELRGRDAHAGMWGKDQSQPTGASINLSDVALLHAGDGPNAASGVLLGSAGGGGNQDNVVVERCGFAGFGGYDVAVHGSGDIDLVGNRCRSTGTRASILVSAVPAGRPVTVGRNRCAGPIAGDAVAAGLVRLSDNVARPA